MCVVGCGCVIWVAIYSFADLIEWSAFQTRRDTLSLHGEFVSTWSFIKIFFLMLKVLSVNVSSFLRNQLLVNIDSSRLIFIIWHKQSLCFSQLQLTQLWFDIPRLSSLRWNFFLYYYLPLNLWHADLALLVASPTNHKIFSIYIIILER
jgi:hypothetical protein